MTPTQQLIADFTRLLYPFRWAGVVFLIVLFVAGLMNWNHARTYAYMPYEDLARHCHVALEKQNGRPLRTRDITINHADILISPV